MADKKLASEVIVTTMDNTDYLQVTIGTDVRRIKITDAANILLLGGKVFRGEATPGSIPDTSVNCFYYAKQAGTYTNYGGLVVNEGFVFLEYDGTWTKRSLFEFGVAEYLTYADLPNPGNVNNHYKVTQDQTAANNGYYHWDGTAYVKDDNLASVELKEFSRWNEFELEPVNSSTLSIDFISSLTVKFFGGRSVYLNGGYIIQLDTTSDNEITVPASKILVLDRNKAHTLNGNNYVVYQTDGADAAIISIDGATFGADTERRYIPLAHTYLGEFYGYPIGRYYQQKVKGAMKNVQFSPWGSDTLNLTFPTNKSITFTGDTYFFKNNLSKYIQLHAATYPVTYSFTNLSECLVFDMFSTKTVGGVLDTYDLESSVYKIGQADFDPNRHLMLLFAYEGKIVDNMGLIGNIRNEFYNKNKTTAAVVGGDKYPLNLVAHRGFSKIAPENTREAILKAYEYGYKFIEFDLHVTSDGEIVVMHDATVDRTTDGTGTVASHTLAELKTLNADYGFAEYENARIPTFAEFLETLKYYGLFPFIEIKDGFSESDVQNVVNIARKYFYDYEIEFHSFYLDSLNFAKQYMPLSTCLYAFDTWTQANIDTIINNGLDGALPTDTNIDLDLLYQLVNKGRKVALYTSDENELETLRLLPVSHILTGDAFYQFQSSNDKIVKKSGIDFADFTLNGNSVSNYIVTINANSVYIDIPAKKNDIVKVVGNAYGDASSVLNITPYLSSVAQTGYSIDIGGDDFQPFQTVKCLYAECDSVRVELKREAGTLYARHLRIEVYDM